MNIKLFLTVSMLFTSWTARAAEFPVGTFTGIGFVVEKGSLRMTHNDLYTYKSSITISRVKENVINTIISATLQKNKHSLTKHDSRSDKFKVLWLSEKKGELMNKDNKYSSDRSEFIISEGKLTIKSWIARNQLWETHIYSLSKESDK